MVDLFYRWTFAGRRLAQEIFKMSDNKGTGLGLVICKMIAEAHDGKISVESDLGKGSMFAVEIPCN